MVLHAIALEAFLTAHRYFAISLAKQETHLTWIALPPPQEWIMPSFVLAPSNSVLPSAPMLTLPTLVPTAPAGPNAITLPPTRSSAGVIGGLDEFLACDRAKPGERSDEEKARCDDLLAGLNAKPDIFQRSDTELAARAAWAAQLKERDAPGRCPPGLNAPGMSIGCYDANDNNLVAPLIANTPLGITH